MLVLYRDSDPATAAAWSGLIGGRREAGERVVAVRAAAAWEHDRDDVSADPTDPAHLDSIVALLDDGPLRVVHALAHGARATLPALEAAHHDTLLPLLHLSAALGARWAREGGELDVLTVDAQAIGPTEGAAGPAATPAVSYALSLRYEFPRLTVRCTDLETWTAAPVALARASAGPAAVRNGTVLVPVLQTWSGPDGADPSTGSPGSLAELAGDGVTVVVGGLGGVGRQLCDLLRRHCRGPLVLLQRRLPDEAAAALLDDWAPAVAVQVDVTDRGRLAEALDAVRRDHGRIAVVIHAAGELADGVSRTKSAADLERVLAAKVRGTWLLDELTADDPPAAFVLCSSTVALYGAAGQADYAAANAFLDAFAEDRRHRRPGLTLAVDWSLWSGTGMAAGLPAHAGAGRREITPLDPTMAADTLVTTPGLPSGRIVVEDREPSAAAVALLGAHAPVRAPAPRAPGTPSGSGTDPHALAAALVRDELAAVGVDAPPGSEDDFFALGVDSAGLLDLSVRLSAVLGADLYPTLLFEHPTPAALARHLAEHHRAGLPTRPEPEVVPGPDTATVPAEATSPVEPRSGDVAVVGYAARLPGAPTADELWAVLRSGRARWGQAQARLPGGEPGGSPVAQLPDVAGFDPLPFRIAPRDAATIDPQHRLALECTWQALEHAGRAGASASGRRTGVYLGVMNSEYEQEAVRAGVDLAAGTGVSRAVLANAVSHALDLDGPSMPVETACSSSAVAVHLGIRALRDGDADTVVAGGVNVILSDRVTRSYADAGLLSPSGACRPFDDSADGYVRGEGVGVVVLRRLADALADGDTIHAVLRGSAVGHNGRGNGLGAPRPQAQVAVVDAALRDAGLRPADVDAVIAHGTGTALGDPVELAALADVLGTGPALPVTSIKGTVGHLESAAGIASLLAAILSLRHGELPPTGGLRTPNRLWHSRSGRCVLVPDPVALPARERPRRIGVSAFGFGGTNCHLIVEEPPRRPAREPVVGTGPQVLRVSAQSDAALEQLLEAMADHLDRHPRISLAGVARTLREGRARLPRRRAVVVATVADASAALRRAAPARSAIVERPDPGSPDDGAWADAMHRAAGFLDRTEADPHPGGESSAERAAGRVPLPTYPFQHTRHWCLDAPAGAASSSPVAPRAAAVTTVRWRRRAVLDPAPGAGEAWLVAGGDTFRRELAGLASGAGHVHRVVDPTAGPGARAAAVRELGSVADLHVLVEPDLTGSEALGPAAVAELVEIVDAARALPAGRRCRITVATTAVSAVHGDATTAFARVLAQEEPALRIRVVEIAPGAPWSDVVLVPPATGADDVVCRVRGRHVLVPQEHPFPVDDAGGYRPPTAWWITGGLGGLGLGLAELLAADGVPIVLTGRRGIPGTDEGAPDRRDRLRTIEERAGELVILPADVSVRSEVERAAAEIRNRFGRSFGVVHAAGTGGRGVRGRHLGAGDLAAVWAAKVAGAVHLDRATRDDELDHFLLVSSSSAWRGGLGLADYAAANGALLAVARGRREQGLPATTIAWGALHDVGIAARTTLDLGGALELGPALAPVRSILAGPPDDLVVAWRNPTADTVVRPHEGGSGLVPADTSGSTAAPGDSPSAVVWALVADAAGTTVDELDPALCLPDLGLDSRAQLALLDTVEDRFGIDLPLGLLGEGSDLRTLGDTVTELVAGAAG